MLCAFVSHDILGITVHTVLPPGSLGPGPGSAKSGGPCGRRWGMGSTPGPAAEAGASAGWLPGACTPCCFPLGFRRSLQLPLPGGSDAHKSAQRTFRRLSRLPQRQPGYLVQNLPLIFTQSGGILHKLELEVSDKPCA